MAVTLDLDVDDGQVVQVPGCLSVCLCDPVGRCRSTSIMK